MKFRALEDFREGYVTFEAENTYDAAKQGLSDSDVKRFHAAGWVECEELGPTPPRVPGAQKLEVASGKHAPSTT